MALAACGGDESDATVGTVAPTSSSTTTIVITTTSATPTTQATTTTETPEFVGAAAFTGNSSVSTVGIDRITFGMTVNQAERAVEAAFVPVADIVDIECYRIRPEGGPPGVVLTVTAGTIERVDITTPAITTRSGAGVGSTEDELTALFGDKLTSTPRGDGGNTLMFTPADASDAAFRVIFETDGTTVTTFRSGRVPQVEPPSYC